MRAASWGSVDSKLTSIKRLLGTRFTLRLPKNSASSGGRFWFARLPLAIASEGPLGEANSGRAERPLLRMVWRESKGRNAGRQGDQLDGAIGAIFTGYEFIFLGHF